MAAILDAAPVTNQTGATSYWNNELYQRTFDYLWAGRIDGRLLGALSSHAGLDGDKVATIYLGNHDHSQVAWQAGARDNAGALSWYRLQPYVIALLTSPGVPMIQNGQEFAEDYWLMENDQGTGRRVKPRPVRWGFKDDRIGRALGGPSRVSSRCGEPTPRSAPTTSTRPGTRRERDSTTRVTGWTSSGASPSITAGVTPPMGEPSASSSS